ncbi:MAG: PIN domain-containing protein [Thermoanaerobaculia bacterium]|nr:PIN domain-containing protein [Thermoanaerobaculia bacterium]
MDTNVLVYAYDRQSGEKHEIAKRFLLDLVRNERFVCSAQVLNELASVLLKRKGLPIGIVREIVEEVSALGIVVPVVGDMTHRALEAVANSGLSFWDALVWVAAREAGATELFTEDFQHDQRLGEVRFVNPFLS